MKKQAPGHDCGLLGCDVSLDGYAIFDVEVYDSKTGALVETIPEGAAMPALPKNRGQWPKEYKGKRPFTRRKVA